RRQRHCGATRRGAARPAALRARAPARRRARLARRPCASGGVRPPRPPARDRKRRGDRAHRARRPPARARAAPRRAHFENVNILGRAPTSTGRVRLRQSETPLETMPQTVEYPQSELEKVESWRLHVLIEAGYPLPLAERLAHSEADLHRAVELIRAGCAFETAAEILI